jgi:hypothetical protein
VARSPGSRRGSCASVIREPPQPGDELIASEVIKRMEAACATETAGMSASLGDLRELTKMERRELESFIT